METEIPLKEKCGNNDIVVDIKIPGPGETFRKAADFDQENSFFESKEEFFDIPMISVTSNTTPSQPITPTPNPKPSAKPPIQPAMRRGSLSKSAYSKPKSRIVEPLYPSNLKPAEGNPQTAPIKSPSINLPNTASPSSRAAPNLPKKPSPTNPNTPLNDDDDNETENLKVGKVVRGRKKIKKMVMIEWIAFICIMGVLITCLTVEKLKGFHIWSLELWKWCALVLVVFCGRLFTEWLCNVLVFLIEKNFLLTEKVLYFVFGLKKSVGFVIWLALILIAWTLLINRGVKRSKETNEILNNITRGIVATLVGAVLWMVKTLLIKLVASSFHVRTYFDRIQESIFHQYILQTLSGTPLMEENGETLKTSGLLSFDKVTAGNQRKYLEAINVDKLYKTKREKVSAWTMQGLIRAIRNSELPTISEAIDESVDEEPKVIASEIEARHAANRIFMNVAKNGSKFIEEDDLLRFMSKEEVDNVIPLFEGTAESRRIKKSSFRNWVVKVYNERKYLAVSLKDAKTAIEELNRIASGLILLVITTIWLLIMEIITTKFLVFISSQLLLCVFIFGNTVKMVFEAIIFVFIMHPFDVGDRCVVDGVQMVVDEMNILTTIFLKADNEKVSYPNSVLATKPISNFNRSPEMGDAVEFAVGFSTSVESIAALRDKIKMYLESKPQHWSPNYTLQIKEIKDVNKMILALYITHTINFQNALERGNRRSDLVFELKRIFEEIGIKYRLLPQEVQIISYAR